MPLRNLPIRRKLMVIILVTSGVVMLMMRAAFFTYEYLAFRQVIARHVASLGDIMAANSTAALAFANHDDAREILGALRGEHEMVAAALYDGDGRLFAHFPAALDPAKLPASPGAIGYRFNGARIAGFQPVQAHGRLLGHLYLEFDTGGIIDAWMWDSVKIGLGVMGFILLVAYVLSRLLQHQVSKPVLALAGTARAVSEFRDYSARATKPGNDELGQLTDAFNHMLDEIQALNQDLEKRVIERTAQLEAANAELNRSRAELQSLFVSIDEGYCILELIFDASGRATDFRFLKVNPSFESLTGLTGVTGRRIREISAQYEDYWFETYGRVALTGEPERFQNYAAPLGRWFDIYAFRYGEPANRHVAVLFRNITEQKARDDEIRQLNARLSDQNRQLRAIFESLPGLCLVLNPDLVIVTATDAYLRATMTTREKLIGLTMFQAFPDNPADPAADGSRNLRASLERVLQHRRVDTMAIQKYDVRRPDGTFEERFWSPVNSPVFGADGQLEYIIHRAEDVTEFIRKKSAGGGEPAAWRERLEKMEAEVYQSSQQVQLANQQLHAANAELESFSYSVSHDLRAPLRHIDGFTNLLQKNSAATLDAQGRRYLETISNSARQMGRLIDDLLSFSRMGRTHMQPVEIDQDALVATVVREGRYPTGVDWRIAALPRAHGDHAMIKQVWANLIDNAVKYSGKVAAPCVEIGGRHDPAAGELVYYVRDNGAGFDMRYATKLYGVFQRLHGVTEFEGTGIGLANVRRILTRHGGRTWAEGEPGRGATFHFALPVNPAPSLP